MEYQYEILRLEPAQEYMSVLYTKSGCPAFSRNFNPSSFDQDTLDALINQGALDAVEFWERAAKQPATVNIPMSGSGTAVSPVVDNFDPNYAPTIEPMPDHDIYTQRVEVAQIEDPMQATVGWNIIPLTDNEQVGILAAQSESMRVERDQRLAATDYWMVADTPDPTPEQLAYRQALRDVPSQVGYPKQIDWPTLPEA
jgi:hypothetical protein